MNEITTNNVKEKLSNYRKVEWGDVTLHFGDSLLDSRETNRGLYLLREGTFVKDPTQHVSEISKYFRNICVVETDKPCNDRLADIDYLRLCDGLRKYVPDFNEWNNLKKVYEHLPEPSAPPYYKGVSYLYDAGDIGQVNPLSAQNINDSLDLQNAVYPDPLLRISLTGTYKPYRGYSWYDGLPVVELFVKEGQTVTDIRELIKKPNGQGFTKPELLITGPGIELKVPFRYIHYGHQGMFGCDDFRFLFDKSSDTNTLVTLSSYFCDSFDEDQTLADFREQIRDYFMQAKGVHVDVRILTQIDNRLSSSMSACLKDPNKVREVKLTLRGGDVIELQMKGINKLSPIPEGLIDSSHDAADVEELLESEHNILAVRPLTLHPEDYYLWVVLRKSYRSNAMRYYTHIYNSHSSGFVSGHYFEEDAEKAFNDFLVRS